MKDDNIMINNDLKFKAAFAVTGGREFTDAAAVETRLLLLLQRTGLAASDVYIADGNARGLDTTAHRVARRLGFLTGRFPADWKAEPRLGGFIRNELMADVLVALQDTHLVGVLAFPGARGTAHMVSYSQSVGLRVSDANGCTVPA